MTKAQLLELAGVLGVEGVTNKSLKSDIVSAIIAHETEDEEVSTDV